MPELGKTLITVPDAAGGAEHAVEVWDADSAQFAARLRKMAKERRKWAARAGVFAYRIYDADLPNYALAVDLYREAETGEASIHVAEYEAPSHIDEAKAACRLEDALTIIPPALGVPEARVYVKTRRRDKGGAQYALNREERRENAVMAVAEPAFDGEPLILEVDLNGYLDTGLFLDHRTTRQLVGAEVARRAKTGEGTRFLNLFAYTGSATVHAAAAGAISTCTVDLSATYLAWAARNMAANGFAGVTLEKEDDGRTASVISHHFERGDVMDWLVRAQIMGRRFDVIFVDPPTFSNSKAMGTRTWDVQRDHVALLTGVRAIMAPGAICYFSNNLRSFRPDEAGLAAAGITLTDITASTVAPDFARNARIHRCYTFTKE